ncbi:MAG TPA: urate hydroxylase PuuD [Rhizomicrobium sp.]|nr:urate hydroxylase PuuD [Rhizomicrobium sp.]HKQ45343.1 urate hydroxylase PuuD [Rhizomicrobium sp.]HKY18235.1 urate hydroxylase PuuD [Rhizomicrobium sp.]
MAAFFGNLRNVVIASFALAILLIGLYCTLQGFDGMIFELFLLRWLHVAAGVMWIGLLWYFNFVQIPTMPKVPDELKKGVSGYIAPEALFWFRWAAMVTIVLGVILALRNGYLVEAYTLGAVEGFTVPKNIMIGIGMWLGTIMWFNVWFVIWPNQQKALNIGGKYSDLAAADKAAAGKTAMIFSRVNTLLSVPMLFCMVAAMHLVG